MTLETRLVALANAIGADIKALTAAQGSLSGLSTTAKGSLVAAINEIAAAVGGAGAAINDSAGSGATTVTWSANQIVSAIDAAKTAVTNSLVNGATAALDTLSELATALNNDPGFAATVATQIANRVRFDAAQTLDSTQKAQALTNIGAVASADIGNPLRDLASDYASAKA